MVIPFQSLYDFLFESFYKTEHKIYFSLFIVDDHCQSIYLIRHLQKNHIFIRFTTLTILNVMLHDLTRHLDGVCSLGV